MKPIETRAYRLFLDELSCHITHAREVVTSVPSQGAEWNSLATAFHTVKGGAGFFGLDQVESLASEIETRLKQPLELVLKQCDELAKLVNKMEQLKKDLSPPQEGR